MGASLGHVNEGSNSGLWNKMEGVWVPITVELLTPRLLHKRKINCYPVEPLLILVFVIAAEHTPMLFLNPHTPPKPN